MRRLSSAFQQNPANVHPAVDSTCKLTIRTSLAEIVRRTIGRPESWLESSPLQMEHQVKHCLVPRAQKGRRERDLNSPQPGQLNAGLFDLLLAGSFRLIAWTWRRACRPVRAGTLEGYRLVASESRKNN
jgi:hypothetical protein